MANADALQGGFFFADDEHVRDPFQLGIADFGANFVRSGVQSGAQVGGLQLG